MNFDKCWGKENVRATRQALAALEGDHWRDEIYRFIDSRVDNIWLTLAYLAKQLKATRYAEVGTRWGYSLCVVAARRPRAHLVSFDAWVPEYAGVSNPGPDFVRAQLDRVGYRGLVRFVEGNSRQTVPGYDAGELFPLILVDGDHSEEGCYQDIANCLRLLAPGGYLVVDDMQDPFVAGAFERAAAEGYDLHAAVSGRVGVLHYADA